MKIKVDGKDYELPELTVDQWLKVISAYEKSTDKATSSSLFEKDGVETTIEFYYHLLNPTYPELTKPKLKKMPLYQLGLEFSAKVFQALTEIPLDSRPDDENEKV